MPRPTRRIPWRLIGLGIVLSLVLHGAVLGVLNEAVRRLFGLDDPLRYTLDIDLTQFTFEELWRLAGETAPPPAPTPTD